MLLTFALHAARNVNTSEIEVFRAFESSLLFPSLFSILNPSRTEELCFLKLSVVFTPRNVFSFSFFCFLLHHFAASPVVKLKSLFYFTQVFSSIQAKHCAFFFVFLGPWNLSFTAAIYWGLQSASASQAPVLIPSSVKKFGVISLSVVLWQPGSLKDKIHPKMKIQSLSFDGRPSQVSPPTAHLQNFTAKHTNTRLSVFVPSPISHVSLPRS